MQFQFNSDSSVMGTDNVAERIEAAVRAKLARFEDRLTRVEVHVRDVNGSKHGADDKECMIEARPRGGKPIGVIADLIDPHLALGAFVVDCHALGDQLIEIDRDCGAGAQSRDCNHQRNREAANLV